MKTTAGAVRRFLPSLLLLLLLLVLVLLLPLSLCLQLSFLLSLLFLLPALLLTVLPPSIRYSIPPFCFGNTCDIQVSCISSYCSNFECCFCLAVFLSQRC